MSRGLGKSGRRILYILYKETECKTHNFSFCGLSGAGGRGKAGKHAAYEILYRLRDKGLISITEHKNDNTYSLTDEGKKVALPIVKLIDYYKKW